SQLARERYAQAREIPWSDADRDALTAAFAPERCEVRSRELATRDALLDARVRDAAILSVFAHGAYDALGRDDDERPAALVLAPRAPDDDGILWCSDVERLHAPPLVELLACSGARGPARLGDDCAGHLVGAFLAAGADCVIASRTDLS